MTEFRFLFFSGEFPKTQERGKKNRGPILDPPYPISQGLRGEGGLFFGLRVPLLADGEKRPFFSLFEGGGGAPLGQVGPPFFSGGNNRLLWSGRWA